MTEPTATPNESLEYRAEVKQLLDILAHSLYADREVFLRELISNASDALNRVQFEMLTNHDVVDPEAELAIHLAVDEENRTLIIRDTGIGMNRDELVENLGTIAHSGARTFLQNAAKGQGALEEIIGQFGVGFYSVFMVADEVTVTSRSYRAGDAAAMWRSTGDSKFSLFDADKDNRGTEIRIKLKEDAAEFAQPWRLESVVRKHSDYVSFPIYLDGKEGEPRPINRRTALWRQSPSSVEASQYDEFYKQLTLDDHEPLLHVHLVADAPVNVRAVLFVPSQRERGALRLTPDYGLRLYSRKVLIQDRSRDLLPEHFRFVEGVVDSEDLPLNVSRETVQSNPVMRQLKRALTNRLIKEIRALAENDDAKYLKLWTEYGIFLKQGVIGEPGSQESLADLLRFHSSHTGADAWTDLKGYVTRMQPEQQAIYYVLGDNLATTARSPHLDTFRAHNIEVLYLVDPIDGYMASMLREFDGKPLHNVDDANLDLPANNDEAQPAGEAAPQEDFDKLVSRFRSVLGERVRDVRESKALVDSPARLVSAEDSFERDLQYLRRLMEDDYKAPAKILELNRRHPLVVHLATRIEQAPDDALIDASIQQVLDNLLLLEGSFSGSVADLVARMQQLMAAALE
jgi:molecular chaperone HtpG